MVDDGKGNVSEIMRDLHEKASLEIEEEDRRKKHRLAITEASLSKEMVPDVIALAKQYSSFIENVKTVAKKLEKEESKLKKVNQSKMFCWGN